MKKLTQTSEELHAKFRYDANSGTLYLRAGFRRPEKEAGFTIASGHAGERYVNLGKKQQFLVSRVIYKMMRPHEFSDRQKVKYVDGDHGNTRLNNLTAVFPVRISREGLSLLGLNMDGRVLDNTQLAHPLSNPVKHKNQAGIIYVKRHPLHEKQMYCVQIISDKLVVYSGGLTRNLKHAQWDLALQCSKFGIDYSFVLLAKDGERANNYASDDPALGLYLPQFRRPYKVIKASEPEETVQCPCCGNSAPNELSNRARLWNQRQQSGIEHNRLLVERAHRSHRKKTGQLSAEDLADTHGDLTGELNEDQKKLRMADLNAKLGRVRDGFQPPT